MCAPATCFSKLNRAPGLSTKIINRKKIIAQMTSNPIWKNPCLGVVPYCNKRKKIVKFPNMNQWRHLKIGHQA